MLFAWVFRYWENRALLAVRSPHRAGCWCEVVWWLVVFCVFWNFFENFTKTKILPRVGIQEKKKKKFHTFQNTQISKTLKKFFCKFTFSNFEFEKSNGYFWNFENSNSIIWNFKHLQRILLFDIHCQQPWDTFGTVQIAVFVCYS